MKRMIRLAALALLWAGPAGAVEYKGVAFEVSTTWITSLAEGTVYPVRYQLVNRGAPQKIQVVVEADTLRYTRTHAMEKGETVNGFVYLPVRQQYQYGRAHFVGERSGTLPVRDWITVSRHADRDAMQSKDSRLLLVGRTFDLTGLDAALVELSGASSSSRELFSRVEADSLPTSWTGLSGVGLVVLDQAEAVRLSSDAKTALRDYVFSGGVLFLVSGDAAWCRLWWGGAPGAGVTAEPFESGHGLGTVRQVWASPQGTAAWRDILTGLRTWPSRVGPKRETVLARESGRVPVWWTVFAQLNALRVASPDFRRISYTALWWMMVLFVVMVGPVNYGWLKRRNQLARFLVTVPVISLLSGGLLLGLYLIMEGREARAAVSGITFLSQPERRALAFHRVSVYSPVSLELNYPPDTLVATRFGDEFGDDSMYAVSRGRYGRSSQEEGIMDFTGGVTLRGGLVPPRLVRAFGSVHTRTERGRVVFTRRGDGAVQARNGLGVALTGLLYRDDEGALHEAGAVADGATVDLRPVDRVPVDFRKLDAQVSVPRQYPLPARGYVAVTTENYGLPPLHRRLSLRSDKHIIYGDCGHE